jgi:hypothetical protein
MGMRDFSSLNAAISEVHSGDNEILVNRFIDASSSLLSSASELARAYSRSYSQVEVLKTDANGDVTDVTETVDSHRTGIPDSVVATSLQRVSEYRRIKAALDEKLYEVQEGSTSTFAIAPGRWEYLAPATDRYASFVGFPADGGSLIDISTSSQSDPVSIAWRRLAYVARYDTASAAGLVQVALAGLVNAPDGPVLQLWLHDGQLSAHIPAGQTAVTADNVTFEVEWPEGSWTGNESAEVQRLVATGESVNPETGIHQLTFHYDSINPLIVYRRSIVEAFHRIDADELGFAPDLNDVASAIPSL